MVRISDITNMQILEQLMKNGRAKYVNIAKILKVSETAIRKRIKKMEDKGIIHGYSVEINPKKLEYGLKVILGLDTTPQTYVSMIQNLKKKKEVIRLFQSSGDHMILMECWFENNNKLHEFIKELEKNEGITDICPAIVNEIIK